MSNFRKIPLSTLTSLSSSTPCESPRLLVSNIYRYLWLGRVSPQSVSSALLSIWYFDSSATNRRDFNGNSSFRQLLCNIRSLPSCSIRVSVYRWFFDASLVWILGTANKKLVTSLYKHSAMRYPPSTFLSPHLVRKPSLYYIFRLHTSFFSLCSAQ